MPSSASGRGAATSVVALRLSSAASTWRSATSLSRICVAPSLCLTLRLTVRLPRVTRLPTASRMRASMPS